MSLDKEQLFAPRLPEAEVEIPDVGTVRVRGLNRAEGVIVAGIKDYSASERKMLAFALLDPVMTEAEVGRWQKAATPSELDLVTEKVMELSGTLPTSAKEAVKQFHADPDTTFRVHPGQGPEDDGGSASGADV